MSAIVFTAVLSCVAVPCMGASFDCRKAATEVEHLICGSAEVDHADKQMGEVYAALMAHLPEPARRELRNDQRKWLAFRDQCLGQRNSQDCLVVNINVRRNGLRDRLDAIPGRPVDVYQPPPCVPRQLAPMTGLRGILWLVFSSKADREERARAAAAAQCR